MGTLAFGQEGRVGHFAGVGMMIFLDAPLPCPDRTQRAIQLAPQMREAMGMLRGQWARRAFATDQGIGVVPGHATLGLGFEGRRGCSAIGHGCDLAARLCAEARGSPVPAFNVVGLRQRGRRGRRRSG